MKELNFSLNSLLQDLLNPIVRDAVSVAFKEHITHLNPKPDDPNEMLSARDTARYLGVSLSTLYRYSCRGEINTYGSGKRIWFKKSELDQWLGKSKSKTRENLHEEIDGLLAGRKNKSRRTKTRKP